MIKTRNLMFAAMSCIATMSLTSCATILSGSANKIYIDGDVDEPVTIVTEKQTYENVELPAMVKINRHGIDGQRVKIKLENYEYKDIVLEKKINAVTFGICKSHYINYLYFKRQKSDCLDSKDWGKDEHLTFLTFLNPKWPASVQ